MLLCDVSTAPTNEERSQPDRMPAHKLQESSVLASALSPASN
jgi:hypothetical protein